MVWFWLAFEKLDLQHNYIYFSQSVLDTVIGWQVVIDGFINTKIGVVYLLKFKIIEDNSCFACVCYPTQAICLLDFILMYVGVYTISSLLKSEQNVLQKITVHSCRTNATYNIGLWASAWYKENIEWRIKHLKQIGINRVVKDNHYLYQQFF